MKRKTFAEFVNSKVKMDKTQFEEEVGCSFNNDCVEYALVYTGGLFIEYYDGKYFLVLNNRDWMVDNENDLHLLESALYVHYKVFVEEDEVDIFTYERVYHIIEATKEILKDFYGWEVDYLEEIELREDNKLYIQLNINNGKTPGIWVIYSRENDYVKVVHDFPKDFLKL